MGCQEWLKKYLTDEGGFVLCDRVREEAKKMGFSRRDLKAARECLGVKTFHQFDECGATDNWFWRLGGD